MEEDNQPKPLITNEERMQNFRIGYVDGSNSTGMARKLHHLLDYQRGYALGQANRCAALERFAKEVGIGAWNS